MMLETLPGGVLVTSLDFRRRSLTGRIPHERDRVTMTIGRNSDGAHASAYARLARDAARPSVDEKPSDLRAGGHCAPFVGLERSKACGDCGCCFQSLRFC